METVTPKFLNGKRIDFTEADIETCRNSFATCEGEIRFNYDTAVEKANGPTVDFETAIRKAIRTALTDDACDCFTDKGDEDTPTEPATNGRLLDLGAVLTDAEGYIADFVAADNTNEGEGGKIAA